MKNKTQKKIILGVLIFILLSQWMTGWLINSEWINGHLKDLKGGIQAYPGLAVVAYYLLLSLCISFSIPVTAMMTILSGMIFPLPLALCITVCSAMTGASFNFMLTKRYASHGIKRKYSQQIAKINKEIEANGSHYLLTLRLVPLFPFVVVNLAFGLTAMSFKKYFIMTLIGILPGTYAYASLGQGLQYLSEEGMHLSPQVTLPLILIGFLSLMPVLYKKLHNKNPLA